MTELRKHKNGYNLVSFTAIEVNFGMVAAKNHISLSVEVAVWWKRFGDFFMGATNIPNSAQATNVFF